MHNYVVLYGKVPTSNRRPTTAAVYATHPTNCPELTEAGTGTNSDESKSSTSLAVPARYNASESILIHIFAALNKAGIYGAESK
jgi:hypothetical protein